MADEMLAEHPDHRFLEVLAVALRGEADAATTADYLGDDDRGRRAIATQPTAGSVWSIARSPSGRTPHNHPTSMCSSISAGPSTPELTATTTRTGGVGWPAMAPTRSALAPCILAVASAEALLHADDPPPDARSLARSLLSEAHATTKQLAAKPLLASIEDLATRARIELRSDGQPDAPPRATDPVPFDLTPRELSVIGLVARGYSNGRIGKELFISTKTASVHVSNILRKLGAANRIEAAAIANAAGITDDSGATEESDLELTGQ